MNNYLNYENEKSTPKLPEPIKAPYRHVFAYLESRGISKETIQLLMNEHLLYEAETYHDMVFVNEEKTWAEIHGTNSFLEKICANKETCCFYLQKENNWCTHMEKCTKYQKSTRHRPYSTIPNGYWLFSGKSETSKKAYICKSAIDAISLFEIHSMQGESDDSVYISIGGTRKQGTINIIKEKYTTILAVGNDLAGDRCRKNNPDIDYIIPKRGDWNDDLRALKGFL